MATEPKSKPVSKLFSGSTRLEQTTNETNLKIAENQYNNKQKKLTRKVNALNQQKIDNQNQAKALTAKKAEIDKRGSLASLSVAAIDLVKSPFTDGNESDLLTKQLNKLAISQKDAIDKQNALVDEYADLQQEKQKLDDLKLNNLNSQKAALTTELENENENLDSLKTSLSEDTADNMADEVARRDYLDAQIKDSQAKVKALNDAQQKNIAATADAKAESNTSISSPIQKCPDQCVSHDIVVKCNHEGGKRIAVPGVKPSETTPFLQVVSVPYGALTDIDEISVYIDGSCDQGKNTLSPLNNVSGLLKRNQAADDIHCPFITIVGGEPVTDIRLPGTVGSPIKFNAYAPKAEWSGGLVTKPSWAVFIKHLFFTDQNKKFCTYRLEGASCDGPGTNAIAKVQAFTREKWTMEAGFSWEKVGASDLKTKKNLTSKTSKEMTPEDIASTKWAIDGKASGTVGTDTFVLEAKPDFLTGVTQTLSHLLYFFDSVDSSEPKKKKETKPDEVFSWKWIPPKIAIAGEREIKENPSNNLVDTAYKYSIKLDPFFGIGAKVDVLQALINLAVNCAAPGAGAGAIMFVQFVQEVLLKTEDKAAGISSNVSFKAAINLDMELVLAGELSVEKVFGGSDPEPIYKESEVITNESLVSTSKTAAEVAAVGKMSLTGYVKAEFRHSNSWFIVHAAAGAGFVFGTKGGAPTELALKIILDMSSGKPTFKGELDFKGLILSFMSYATASIDRAETDVKDDDATSEDDDLETFDDDEEPLKEELIGKDAKEVWTIFKPKNFPFWE